jgi:hypothetical protein
VPDNLSPEDQAEIDRITAEIMAGMDCFQPSVFKRHVKQVLAREAIAARQAYEAALAADTVHKWEFGEHPISRCQPDWCGRYRGQRRDVSSTERQTWKPAQLKPEAYERITGKPWHETPEIDIDIEPPPAPAGPAAYCVRCARSGVGVCDDYPDCPAGRASRGPSTSG